MGMSKMPSVLVQECEKRFAFWRRFQCVWGFKLLGILNSSVLTVQEKYSCLFQTKSGSIFRVAEKSKFSKYCQSDWNCMELLLWYIWKSCKNLQVLLQPPTNLRVSPQGIHTFVVWLLVFSLWKPWREKALLGFWRWSRVEFCYISQGFSAADKSLQVVSLNSRVFMKE